VPEPAGPDRLRNLGRPSFLIGWSSGLNEPPTKLIGGLETRGQEHDPSMKVGGVDRSRVSRRSGFRAPDKFCRRLVSAETSQQKMAGPGCEPIRQPVPARQQVSWQTISLSSPK